MRINPTTQLLISLLSSVGVCQISLSLVTNGKTLFHLTYNFSLQQNGLIRPQARTISWSRPNYDDDSCGSVAVEEWTGFQILTTWWWWSLGCLRLGLECKLRLLIRLLNDLADSDRYFRLGVWREEEASHFFFEKLCQWFIAEIRQLYGMKFATLLWFVRLIRRIFVRTMHRQVCVPLVTPRNAHWPQRSAAWLIADRYRHAGKRSR